MTDCSRNCWIFAALMGAIVLILALGPGGAGIFGGLILAIVTALLLGGLLAMMFCGGARDRSDITTLGLSEPHDRWVSFAAPQAAARDEQGQTSRAAGSDLDHAQVRSAHEIQGAPAGASSDPRQAATFEPSAARRAAAERAEEEAAASVIRMGAPEGASSDPAKAVTFSAHNSGAPQRTGAGTGSGHEPGKVVDTVTEARDRKHDQSRTVVPSADQAERVQDQPVSANPAAGQTAEALSVVAKPHHARAGGAIPAGEPAKHRGADRDANAPSGDTSAVKTVAGDKKTAAGAAKAPDGTARDSVAADSKASAPLSATPPSATAAPKPRQAAPSQPAETGRAAKDTEAPAKRKAEPRATAVEPDELGRIYGVGPKLTEWLHDNGIHRFAQIAAWTPEDVLAWADRLDRDGGRIERDDWVGQARILAAGGETEHSRRVDRGEST